MLTFSFNEFIAGGGMQAKERAAAEQAITEERKFWLPILESWAANLVEEDVRDLIMHAILDGEIRRLRRMLRLPPKPSQEAVKRRREQTRERVQRYRERQRQMAE